MMCLVASNSLVCLPDVDAGGHGPKVSPFIYVPHSVSCVRCKDKQEFDSSDCRLCIGEIMGYCI